MDLAVPDELGVLQTRDHAQHASLFGEAHVILKSHQIVAAAPQVFLTKLHRRVWPSSGLRVGQANRFHGPEAKSLTPAPSQFFYGKASFEKRRPVFRDVRGHAGPAKKRIHESLVLRFVERAIHVVVTAVDRLAIARSAKSDRHVDGVRFNDRADAVIEEQPVNAGESSNFLRESIARQRSGGDDRNRMFRKARELAAAQFNQRVGFDGACNPVREPLAIHRERVATGNPGRLCAIQKQ